MAIESIETVSFPSKNGGPFHSYVRLPDVIYIYTYIYVYIYIDID